MRETWQRCGGITVREVGDSLFLSNGKAAKLFRLNTLGAAVWNMLDKPHRDEDLVALFALAFSDVPRATLEQDISALLQDMRQQELIEPSPSAGCTPTLAS